MADKIDRQAVEYFDFHVFHVPSDLAHQVQSLIRSKQSSLFRITTDPNNELVKQLSPAFDDIQVAQRDRIKRPRINCFS